MRALSACLLWAACSAAALAADAKFVRVWPGWRNAESFERISEYVTGRDHAEQTTLRTQAEVRAGYYFLVRLDHEKAAPNSRFELSVIRPDSSDVKTFTFPVTLSKRETVFHLGLTGQDWPGGEAVHPVAWKIALRDAAGQVIAEHKSFLWEKPAK